MGRKYVPPVFEAMPWRVDAACKGVDPDLFYPQRGESVDAAKQICDRCPVRSECLEYALRNNETVGIWGGTSERDRRKIRKDRRASKEAELAASLPEGHKLCSGCNTPRPFAMFHRDSTAQDGLNSRCCECRTVYNARRPKAA